MNSVFRFLDITTVKKLILRNSVAVTHTVSQQQNPEGLGLAENLFLLFLLLFFSLFCVDLLFFAFVFVFFFVS